MRSQGQIIRTGVRVGALVEGSNGWFQGDGQGRDGFQCSGRVDWREGDAFQQEGELRNKAH